MGQDQKQENKTMGRHEQRMQALDFVFESMFRDDSTEDAFEDAFHARDVQVGEYAEKLILGVREHLPELDGLIEANLKGWKKNRIARISLTILRIAVFEMLYAEDVPVSVSINEAVELAKSYATAEDGAFVNGVLGSISKTLEKRGEA